MLSGSCIKVELPVMRPARHPLEPVIAWTNLAPFRDASTCSILGVSRSSDREERKSTQSILTRAQSKLVVAVCCDIAKMRPRYLAGASIVSILFFPSPFVSSRKDVPGSISDHVSFSRRMREPSGHCSGDALPAYISESVLQSC